MDSSRKIIGILYIATGPYIVFWKDFYESFEKFFLPDLEKKYFIFTDAKHFPYSDSDNVYKIYQKSEPWPLPTLLKFHRFLEIKDKLLQCDYLYQSNANIVCKDFVYEEDFLPQEKKGEKLFFTIHPGYCNAHPYEFPYDRNKKSKAYVPYNCGKVYVFGAMNGGVTKDYLAFIEKIDFDIIDDLKKGVIAQWHDESHVNHDIIKCDNYRLLPAAFCYPVGFEISDKCIIAGVDKKKAFDVDVIKKNKLVKETRFLYWKKRILNNSKIYRITMVGKMCRDRILRRKVI